MGAVEGSPPLDLDAFVTGLAISGLDPVNTSTISSAGNGGFMDTINATDTSAIDDVHKNRDNDLIDEINLELDQKVYAGKWWDVGSYPLHPKDEWGRIPDIFYKEDAGKPCPRMSVTYMWDRKKQYFRVKETCYLSTNNYTRSGIMTSIDKSTPRKMILKYSDKNKEEIYYDILTTDYNEYSIVKIRNIKYTEKEYRIIVLSRKKYISKNEARALIRLVDNLGYDGSKLEAHPSVISN
jgi:lipocalin